MKTALVTGASGFIGRVLCQELQRQEYRVRALMRHQAEGPWDEVVISDLSANDTPDICHGVDSVFHLASLVHAIKQKGTKNTDYYLLNVEGTKKVVAAAKKSNVKSFVYFSSIKAVADPGKECVDESWFEYPTDVYGKSKRKAEECVLALNNSGINASAIRSALVYGKGVKGNLQRMIGAIDNKKMPNINQTENKRSMISVEDLVSLAISMSENNKAANNIYFATDGQTYSTKRIYDVIANALKIEPGVKIPVSMIWVLGLFLGLLDKVLPYTLPINREMTNRLIGSACYLSGKACKDLDWQPNCTFESEIENIIQYYKKSQSTCLQQR